MKNSRTNLCRLNCFKLHSKVQFEIQTLVSSSTFDKMFFCICSKICTALFSIYDATVFSKLMKIKQIISDNIKNLFGSTTYYIKN